MTRARARFPATVYASKLEAEYSLYLQARQQRGEIIGWLYEPIKLRLAKATWFTPDFLVIETDGTLTFHEVKGWWRDDARVKLKVAAELFTIFRFVAVTRDKRTKTFTFETFGPKEER